MVDPVSYLEREAQEAKQKRDVQKQYALQNTISHIKGQGYGEGGLVVTPAQGQITSKQFQ